MGNGVEMVGVVCEEVLAGGEIVWACEGWIINRLCGEGNGWGWLEAKGEWEEENDERRLGSTKTVGGAAPLLEIGLALGLGFVFCIFLMFQNCPPLCLSCEPVFIGKMLHGSQNWSLNFLSFFCKI